MKSHPWTYAIVLFLVSKLVNSQAAALTAVAPMGLMLGIDPKMLVAFFPASYGYLCCRTYPSDLACIGFDRSGTTRIGKFIINHSFILPGLDWRQLCLRGELSAGAAVLLILLRATGFCRPST